ncbi:MAG: hypothetical protein LIO94_07360 [Clostridiales bacterium]|nr:hypothetical protein [Clostridiales bacterium]
MKPFMPRKPADYESRLKELDEKQEAIELKKKVRDREIQLGLRRDWKKPAWSKAMMILIFAVCIEIIIYSEWVMFTRYDLSALYALIGVPAAMFGVFWTYCEKSKAENTKGGITYDTAMKKMEPDNNESDIDPGDGVG